MNIGVHLALKCDIWWQYFNGNQLTTFRVYLCYWLIQDFYHKFLRIIALRTHYMMDAVAV